MRRRQSQESRGTLSVRGGNDRRSDRPLADSRPEILNVDAIARADFGVSASKGHEVVTEMLVTVLRTR